MHPLQSTASAYGQKSPPDTALSPISAASTIDEPAGRADLCDGLLSQRNRLKMDSADTAIKEQPFPPLISLGCNYSYFVGLGSL